MKLSKTQLKQIIRESYRRALLESGSPQDLYNRMKELESAHRSEIDTIRRLGVDRYAEILELRDSMKSEDPSYDNYGNFLSQVRSSIMAGTAYDMWFEERKTFLPADEAAAVSKEYNDLKSQFKRVNTTSQADMRYGRKRYAMEHIPTGERIGLGTDRKGSLGS